jgi:hypothetical protein
MTSVYQNTAAIGQAENWVAIPSSDYHLDSETGEVTFASSVSINPKSASYSKNLRFIYVTGYSSVPEEIVMACEELVANALKKQLADNLNARVRFSRPAAISFSDKTVFTDDIKEMLEPYRQMRM